MSEEASKRDDAVRMALREEQENLVAFEDRVVEPETSYEALLKDLKTHRLMSMSWSSRNRWPKTLGPAGTGRQTDHAAHPRAETPGSAPDITTP